MKLLPLLKKLRRDERGISAVEYAILIGVVGVGLVAALGATSGSIKTYVSGQIKTLNTDSAAATKNAQTAPK
jgi:Flp pilus assembly pilin Flp